MYYIKTIVWYTRRRDRDMFIVAREIIPPYPLNTITVSPVDKRYKAIHKLVSKEEYDAWRRREMMK